MRHQYAWDLRGIPDRQHRKVIWGALAACDYPFSRIRRNTGKRVPVTVSDLSRWMRGNGSEAHFHAHDPDTGEHAHGLADSRRGALGLYWLPTEEHPAGRVELEQSIMADVAPMLSTMGCR